MLPQWSCKSSWATPWKLFYGEEPVHADTVVPEQLKQIIGHQLGLMADELVGNDEQPTRKQADKRARKQGEELTQHTEALQKAARKHGSTPY